MTKKKKKNQKRAQSHRQLQPRDQVLPFIDHVVELRQRFFYCLTSVVVIAIATYFVQQQLVRFLLRPAHGQQFIYTSPGGGISFLFNVCIYVGIALSVPLIVYHLLRYVEPLLYEDSLRFIVSGSLISGLVAICGMTFGYYIGLPAVLHFLLHQFTSQQIKPLLTIQSYLSFVMIYMVGSALLFQVPLILICINRVRPLKPRQLFHYEKFIILLAFIVAALMNPTPNLVSQLMLAGPIIVTYQLGIGLIALINRRRKPKAKVIKLLAQDAETQAQRLVQAAQAKTEALANNLGIYELQPIADKETVETSQAAETSVSPATPRRSIMAIRPIRRRLYVNDVRPSY